jgi:outer membrane protein OmpA-like peptidoglycan-associated protein
MQRASLAFACALSLLAAAPVPLMAQSTDMSQEEIAERFRAQKTRGLRIVPVTPDSGQNAGATQTTTVDTVPVTQAGIADLPPEEQVNINISFDFDSAALREDQKPKLTSLCGAMKAVAEDSFRIIGHTDASGTDEYNKRLSKLRAEEVKRFLVTDCGIAPERLEALGVGEEMLFDPENPRGDANRRVEFQVVG